MKLFEIKNLSLAYDKKNKIVDNISFDVEEGEFISIIGPNASGKSTLIRSIAKILKPISGSIKYKGKDIHKYKSKEYAKMVSYVPQIAEFPSDITVYEFVKMGRFPYSQLFTNNSKIDKEKIEDAIKQVNLVDYKDTFLSDLSGGQKQRAIIALALAQDTETIVLDEPTNHLDIKHQLEIIHLLHDLNHTYKKTIIMVIHDINHGIKFADKIIVMNNGLIYSQGQTNQVINKNLLKNVFGVSAQIILSENRKIISDYWIDGLARLSEYKEK